MSRVVGDYVLFKKLGQGSFASVYKAHHKSDANQIVAMKSVSRNKLNAKLQENLESEIGILEKINHPNVVRLFGKQRTERNIYLIMEYCNGGDLHRYIRRHKRLSLPLCHHLMKDFSAGLKFLWEHKLIHRDLKPQNLLLSTSPTGDMDKNGNPRVTVTLKIADFGFARHLAEASMAETLCGSPLYMAPEILRYQKYDGKADLWSVGTILFEMLFGRPPYNGSNPRELLRNIEKSPIIIPQNVQLNRDVVYLLQQLLQRSPKDRMNYPQFFENPFVNSSRRQSKSSEDEFAQGKQDTTKGSKITALKTGDADDDAWEMVTPEEEGKNQTEMMKTKQLTSPILGRTVVHDHINGKTAILDQQVGEKRKVDSGIGNWTKQGTPPNQLISTKDMESATCCALAYAASVGDRACMLADLSKRFSSSSALHELELPCVSVLRSEGLNNELIGKVIGLALIVKSSQLLQLAVMAADDAVDASSLLHGMPNIASNVLSSDLRDRFNASVATAKRLIVELKSEELYSKHVSTPTGEQIMFETAIEYCKKGYSEESILKDSYDETAFKRSERHYRRSITLFQLLSVESDKRTEKDKKIVRGYISMLKQKLDNLKKQKPARIEID